MISAAEIERRTYLCWECGENTGPRESGYSVLIKSGGKTLHFCSGACLRATINAQPVARAERTKTVQIAQGLGWMFIMGIAAVVAAMLAHVKP